jgi:hypothetical protein
MLAHAFRQLAHADARKVVDGEARVARVVCREDAGEALLQLLRIQLRPQLRHAQRLGQVLKEDLDEDAAAGRRVLFVQAHDREHVPAQPVRAEHVPKEAGNVAQPVRLVAVDGLVVLGEGSFEEFGPQPVQLGKALAQ